MNINNQILNRMKNQLVNKALIKEMLIDLSDENRFILLSRKIDNLNFKEIAFITG